MSFRIVVLGGSFNPPTLGHKKIMQTAVDHIEAQMGIFVPVSHAYLKRKLRKEGGRICFSEEERMRMLNYLCADDERLSATDLEYGTAMAATRDTLRMIQERYPQAELYFLVGVDKKDLIMKWASEDDFLQKYRLMIVEREGVDCGENFLDKTMPESCKEAMVFMKQPKGIEQISSTEVRRRMNQGENLEGLVHPKVAEMLKGVSEKDYPEEINRFVGEYDFLSNNYAATFVWEGITWGTAENAFQGSKFSLQQKREAISKMSPEKAKQHGNMFSGSAEWEANKIEIMENILREKFSQNPELEEKLFKTGNKVLSNGNNGKDLLWGVDRYSFRGENYLGKLLMKIREERRGKNEI